MPTVKHFAIPADDSERAVRFYEQVFGWSFEVGWEYDTPGGKEKYWKVNATDGQGEGINGGLTRREYPGQPISISIEVPDVADSTALVEKSGGKVIVNKVALPGVAWFAVCQDSEGNTFAMFQPDTGAI